MTVGDHKGLKCYPLAVSRYDRDPVQGAARRGNVAQAC